MRHKKNNNSSSGRQELGLPSEGDRTSKQDASEAVSALYEEGRCSEPGKSVFNSLAGFRLCIDSPEKIAREAIGVGGNVRGRWFACLNPHSYVVALEDVEYRDALNCSDWLLPDGIGIVVASKILGCGVSRRVTGWDVFRAVMNEIEDGRTGHRVFFLGSTDDVLDKVVARARHEYPHVTIAGRLSPPFVDCFDAETSRQICEVILESAADVLWVAMTAPKQEKWLASHISATDVRFAGAVGAVFDFYAGTVRRSGRVWQRLGLEWLPRLVQEPRRLWRRTFISAPIFAWRVLKLRLSFKRWQ